MVKRVSPAKKGRPAARAKKKRAFKGRPAPAPAPRRKKGGGKRSFRKFSVRDPFRPKGSDGAEVDASPFELTMNSVRLSRKNKVLGMDETRRKTQRKLIWYWQFSRNWQVSRTWNWRQIAEALSINPEKSWQSAEEPDAAKKHKDWIWFWRWRDWQNKKRKKRKRTKGSLLLSPKRARLIGISGDEEISGKENSMFSRYRFKKMPGDKASSEKSRTVKDQSLAELLNQTDEIKVSRRLDANANKHNYQASTRLL